MSNHENLSSNEVELTMLRSDLTDFFQIHAEETAIQQSDDWERPAEIVIAGTCHFKDNDGKQHHIEVHIRQRIDQNGTNYLLIFGNADNSQWRQITDTTATSIYQGEATMTLAEVNHLRWLIRPDITEWNDDVTQRCASIENIYESADLYAGREASH